MKLYLGVTCWIKGASIVEIQVRPTFFTAADEEEATAKIRLETEPAPDNLKFDRCTAFAAELNLEKLKRTIEKVDGYITLPDGTTIDPVLGDDVIE